MAARWNLPLSGRIGLFASMLLACSAPAAAQLVSGKVVEEGSERPVGGAMIELMDTTGLRRGAVVADTAGSFRIMVPQPGAYRLRVVYGIYATREEALEAARSLPPKYRDAFRTSPRSFAELRRPI